MSVLFVYRKISKSGSISFYDVHWASCFLAISCRRYLCEPNKSWSRSSAQQACPVHWSKSSSTPSESWKSIAVVSIQALSVFLASSTGPFQIGIFSVISVEHTWKTISALVYLSSFASFSLIAFPPSESVCDKTFDVTILIKHDVLTMTSPFKNSALVGWVMIVIFLYSRLFFWKSVRDS